MAKILYACLRHESADQRSALLDRVILGASRLSPNSESARPPYKTSSGRFITAIMNPSEPLLAETRSVGIGHVAGNSDWAEIGASRPEGSYAICRSNGELVELLSDMLASRTLWYFMDADLFIASTSQRWIVTVLESFELNPNVLPWMVTTGTLGPEEGWDRRLSRLPPESTLTVDLRNWTTSLRRGEVEFKPSRASAATHKENLRACLEGVVKPLQLDTAKWILPLSGGYDSRALLCLLGSPSSIRTVTWGTKAALENSRSDAAIASRLARSVGVSHEYFETESSQLSLADVFDKFVAFGEGRIDHFSGYIDGFAIWRGLLERGVAGVIRGDESFGWNKVQTHDEARKSVELLLWEDFRNLPSLESLGWDTQEVPTFLARRDSETPALWRDRLYQEYRIPTMLAALTDLKATFVEIVNPFLSPSIIAIVRTMPDELRTNKGLFKTIVDELGPAVPYARFEAIANPVQILRTQESVKILADTLNSDSARAVFPRILLEHATYQLGQGSGEAGKSGTVRLRHRLRDVIPLPVRSMLRRLRPKPALDPHKLAFRLFLACKSYELFAADAAARPSQRSE